MEPKFVFFFGGGKAAGNRSMKEILGGKGAGLAEMTNIGIPVPAGFTISTEVCSFFYEHGGAYPPGLREEVEAPTSSRARSDISCGTKAPISTATRRCARAPRISPSLTGSSSSTPPAIRESRGSWRRLTGTACSRSGRSIVPD